MRSGVWLLIGLSACAGVDETPALERLARVEGALSVAPGAGGNAWVFLYRPGEGFPGTPVVPEHVTAVGPEQVAREGPYRFLPLEPNPYRLFGLLDANANFDPQVDVLAQPGAGDWVSVGMELNVQPGKLTEAPLEVRSPLRGEPPALSVDGAGPELVLDADPNAAASFPVKWVDAGGALDEAHGGFLIGLADPDGDGRPQDGDGDGVPDLTLQFFLRWKPLPGQLDPAAQVIVPLAFDPTAFLQELGGRVGLSVRADRLTLTVVPVAQQLSPGKQGRITRTALGAIPRGEYELVALAGSGQFWRVPNALGASQPGQATRFRFDRVAR